MKPGTKVAAGIIGACGLVSLVLLAVMLGHKGTSGTNEPGTRSSITSRYPPPTARREGRTADYYAEDAKDSEYFTCFRACAALHYYGSEGTPFLLAALKYHAGRNSDVEVVPIQWLDGRHVHQEDLALLLPYLSEKYKAWDSVQGAGIRSRAVQVFRAAGHKARPYLSHLQTLRDEPGIPASLRSLLDTSIKDIEE
jgi:hypothetical protein